MAQSWKDVQQSFQNKEDWPVPPSTNTPTNNTIKPNLPTIKTEPQDPNQPNPVQLEQSRKDADGGQIAPFAKLQMRTGQRASEAAPTI